MIIKSGQQAFELQQRFKTIKDNPEPQAYAEIETKKQTSLSSRQFQDGKMKRLYEILNCALLSGCSSDSRKNSKSVASGLIHSK